MYFKKKIEHSLNQFIIKVDCMHLRLQKISFPKTAYITRVSPLYFMSFSILIIKISIQFSLFLYVFFFF